MSTLQTSADVLIVTNWYPPEAAPFGYMMRELAEHLCDRHKRVDVITSVPNHPQGRVFGGWRNKLIQVEHPREGLRVMRIGILQASTPRNGEPRGKWNRVANFLWFSMASVALALVRTRPRVVFAVLQPLTISIPLLIFARLCGAKLIFNVQDLHPDALVSTGVLRNPRIIRLLRRLESNAYRHAGALAVISDGFREHCIRRGGDAARVHVIPNWIDLDEVRPQPRSPALAREYGVNPADFVVLFAGTIGLASGAGILLEVAELLRDHGAIRIVFVGEGQLVPVLKERVADRALRNVLFLPFQPRERLADVQSLADVSVVTLGANQGHTSIPSKVLGYLAAGRPVVASVADDCETARLIRASGAGVVVPPEDAAALAQAIVEIRGKKEEARRMGHRGREYLERNCAKGDVLSRYEAILTS